MLSFVNFGFWEVVALAVVGLVLFVVPVVVGVIIYLGLSKKQQPVAYYPQPQDPPPPPS